MEHLKFKTNINCGGCIKAVTGFINDVEGIESWEVDTQNPDKILSVEGEAIHADRIMDAVKEAGFEIVELAEC